MSAPDSLVVARIREQIAEGFDYCCDTCPVGTLEQLLALAEAAERYEAALREIEESPEDAATITGRVLGID